MTKMMRTVSARSLQNGALAILLLGVLSACATAGKGPVFNDSGVAISGYDAVAYFTQNDAVPGSADHTLEWNNTTWQFSSAENLQQFKENPEKYAPQYGGYCAYAAANNSIAPTDPLAWTVHNDKLYLNFSKHVRTRWQEDVPGNIELADGNWPELKKGL